MVISFSRRPNSLRNIVCVLFLGANYLKPILPALVSLQNDLKSTGDCASGANLFAQAEAVWSLSADAMAGTGFRTGENQPLFSQSHSVTGASLHA